jgi:hypothetical protein
MDEFVCVRLVKANRMDLALLQFDYDLTFAAMFMNADKTVYGRFGTRTEQHDAEKDISLEGLSAALQGALRLHERYPANKEQLAGKQGRPVKYRTPDEYPSLQGKYGARLKYEGKVVQSCMHCHQIRDAQRELYRPAGKPIPDEILFPYPMPNVTGIELDPKHAAKVTRVAPGSLAAQSGLQAGDEIMTLNDQPVLSIADVQWVLHTAKSKDKISAVIRRRSETRTVSVSLPEGWRRATDIKWRVSSWPLRRMGTGGLVLEAVPAADRRRLRIKEGQMALRVKHVGQYGKHAAGKRAGFKKGDVVVSFDAKTDLLHESALLAYAAQATQPGQRVAVGILREGQRMDLKLPMQD